MKPEGAVLVTAKLDVNLPPRGLEALYRGPAIDKGDNYIAVFGRILPPDYNVIPVKDARIGQLTIISVFERPESSY